MMYFQKLLNLASYPKKSPCVLFFIVQKNLFLSPLCYHQIKLSRQMDAVRSASVSADQCLPHPPQPIRLRRWRDVVPTTLAAGLRGAAPWVLLWKFVPRTVRTNTQVLKWSKCSEDAALFTLWAAINQDCKGLLHPSRAGSWRALCSVCHG